MKVGINIMPPEVKLGDRSGEFNIAGMCASENIEYSQKLIVRSYKY
jgi:hypothetical protein